MIPREISGRQKVLRFVSNCGLLLGMFDRLSPYAPCYERKMSQKRGVDFLATPANDAGVQCGADDTLACNYAVGDGVRICSSNSIHVFLSYLIPCSITLISVF
jgi:hypothetical protein